MKLSKLQQIALELLKCKTYIMYLSDDEIIKLITECHRIAGLFLEISEDQEMTWNGGKHE
jgi:hypothetical protein